MRLSARMVLLDIAEHAWRDGVAWPMVKQIAASTKLDEKTVRRSILEAEKLAELEVRDFYRGQVRRHAYRILLPGLDEPDHDRLRQNNVNITKPFTSGHDVRSSAGRDVRSRARVQPKFNRKKSNRKKD